MAEQNARRTRKCFMNKWFASKVDNFTRVIHRAEGSNFRTLGAGTGKGKVVWTFRKKPP